MASRTMGQYNKTTTTLICRRKVITIRIIPMNNTYLEESKTIIK